VRLARHVTQVATVSVKTNMNAAKLGLSLNGTPIPINVTVNSGQPAKNIMLTQKNVNAPLIGH